MAKLARLGHFFDFKAKLFTSHNPLSGVIHSVLGVLAEIWKVFCQSTGLWRALSPLSHALVGLGCGQLWVVLSPVPLPVNSSGEGSSLHGILCRTQLSILKATERESFVWVSNWASPLESHSLSEGRKSRGGWDQLAGNGDPTLRTPFLAPSTRSFSPCSNL